MGKIFCIMGKSSAGKDTIFRNLRQSDDLKEIVTYTTRPKRKGEEDGVHYHFITREEFDALSNSGKVIEARHYDTVNGIWTYATIDNKEIDMASDNNYIIIATPTQYYSLQKYYGEDNLIPIYLKVDDKVRLMRSIHRESMNNIPNYKEVCRRFLKEEEFDKFEENNKDTAYFNTSTSVSCLNEIQCYINKIIKGEDNNE